MTMTYLKKAEEIARKAHAGQTRRGGEPYVNHPERVVNALISLGTQNQDLLCAAWLHDVVEDTDYEFKDDDITNGTRHILLLLTKNKLINYFEYVSNIKGNAGAKLLKLCDIRDNLSNNPTEEQKIKYLKALDILIQ